VLISSDVYTPDPSLDPPADYYTNPPTFETEFDDDENHGSFSRSTIASIAEDYNFPLSYIHSSLLKLGCEPPFSSETIIGDIMDSERCFALLEAVTTLDGASLVDKYSVRNLVDLSEDYDVKLSDVLDASVRCGIELPDGVRSYLRNEDWDDIMEELGLDD
jgi:hypothetical protein